ncbi:MAG: STAS domain-containing protein [Thermoleophilia bacterium]
MSAEHVEVSVQDLTGATLVRVTGVLDALALPEVSRELTDAQRGQDPVYVDLAGVTFMDSRGLGALLAANERSREGAPPVYLHRLSDAVRRLLDVSGVRGVLHEVDDLPEGPAA